MENGQKPAQPLNGDKWQKEIGNGVASDEYKGLTKREYLAAMAMQGLLANPGLHNHERFDLSNCAVVAVDCADTLLKQLDNGDKNG